MLPLFFWCCCLYVRYKKKNRYEIGCHFTLMFFVFTPKAEANQCCVFLEHFNQMFQPWCSNLIPFVVGFFSGDIWTSFGCDFDLCSPATLSSVSVVFIFNASLSNAIPGSPTDVAVCVTMWGKNLWLFFLKCYLRVKLFSQRISRVVSLVFVKRTLVTMGVPFVKVRLSVVFQKWWHSTVRISKTLRNNSQTRFSVSSARIVIGRARRSNVLFPLKISVNSSWCCDIQHRG